MIQCKIDNIAIEVPKGTTVLQAARKLGIDIPTMCHVDGFDNSASCMLCMVKDKRSGTLHPSCALLVSQGMDIVTHDEEVFHSRQQALELLLSDHVGDCEAPCRLGCPVFMDIPRMNRLIAKGNFSEAMRLIKQEMALPLVLGYLCDAPCEKVCRRREVDSSVSICQLIKFVSKEDLQTKERYFPQKALVSGKKVAIIGTGPAGLACAFHLLEKGHKVVMFDKNDNAGGSLRDNQLIDNLPAEILEAELEGIRSFGTEFRLGVYISPEFYAKQLKDDFDAVVFAGGQSGAAFIQTIGFHDQLPGKPNDADTFETAIPGLFACGSAIKPQKSVVKVIAQGKAAALSVDQWLKGAKPEKPHRMFNSKFGKLEEAEKAEYLKEAASIQQLKPCQGVLSGFTKEEAMQEATRCMHCDCRKLDHCKLRKYADEYQADRRKYVFGNRKKLVKLDQHEQVIYEPEKCIRCNLCVEITMRNKELSGLTQVGRGFEIQINVPFNDSMKNALNQSAAECVNACPTAALSFKESENTHQKQ
jgi:NADPH-dependent glutamate synthase beta subunit-like oxidoreductase/ferredoxin